MCCDVAGPQADKRETNTENKKNRSDGLSKLVSIGPDLNNLIDTLVLRKVEPILFCDRRRNEPSTDEVPSCEVLYQGLWGRQADEDIRIEGAANSGLGRPFFDIPR
jgi:hypothetical protein